MLHYELLRAGLEYAPEGFSKELLKEWLLPSKGSEFKELLFHQRLYPPNGNTCEHYFWNLPLLVLVNQLPDLSDNPIANEYRKHFLKEQKHQSEVNPMAVQGSYALSELGRQLFLGPATQCFGRTLRSVADNGTNHYLKAQRATETDAEFVRQTEKLAFFRRHKASLGLKGEMVNSDDPVKLSDLDLILQSGSMDAITQKKFKHFLAADKPPLIRHFSTSEVAKYEHYPFSQSFHQNRQVITEGLRTHGHNAGALWHHDFMAPEVLAAFHSYTDGRKFMSLGALFGRKNQGGMTNWRTSATDYPNVGIYPMATRDYEDTKMPDEFDGNNYLPANRLDMKSAWDRNKVRIHELAKTFEGLVLQLARASFKTLDHESEQAHQWLKGELEGLAIALFGQAFGMSETQCKALLNNDKVLDWATQDINYWCAENAGIVKDVKQGVISPIYDGWESCRPVPLEHRIVSKPDGFYPSERHSSPMLSTNPSGLFGLSALNNLTAKMLTYGILHLLEQSPAEQ